MSRPGISSAPAYQVSGTPFITGGVVTGAQVYKKIEFPSVTKSLTIIAKDASKIWPTGSSTGTGSIHVFFGPEPSGSFPWPQLLKNHYITIPESEKGFTFDIKCTQVFIGTFSGNTSGFQIVAELTSIDKFDLYVDGVRDAALIYGIID